MDRKSALNFIIFLCLIAIIIVGAVKKLLYKDLSASIIPILCIIQLFPALILFYLIKKDYVAIFLKSGFFKVLMAVTASIVTAYTANLVYSFIASSTGINPSSLDYAAKILMLYIFPGSWFLAIFFVIMALYLFQGFYIFVVSLKSSRTRDALRELAIFIGCGMFLVFGSGYVLKFYSEKVSDKFLMSKLVSSGYIAGESFCKNISASQKIAFIDDEKISIAEKKGDSDWVFRVGKCQRKEI